MSYEPERTNEPIKLSAADRKVLADLAETVRTGLGKMESFRARVGAGRLRRIGVVIVQNPDNPDTMQICTDVVSGTGPFEMACWCEPPGICSPGPCSGGMV